MKLVNYVQFPKIRKEWTKKGVKTEGTEEKAEAKINFNKKKQSF